MTLRRFHPLQHADAITIDLQRALRRDAWIELAQRAGGGIARIHKGLFSPRLRLPVETQKPLVTDEHLTAHLQARRCLTLQAQGYRGDGADIAADVLAGSAIATGGAAHQHAVFVEQADRQTIELRLGGVFHLLYLQAFADPAIEIGQLFVIKGIVQGQHGQRMLHRAKGLDGFGADPLGRGIRGDGIGMTLLQFLQFAQQAVVFGVGDLGVVEDVIAVVMVMQLGAQLFDALEVPGLAHGLERRLRTWRAVRAACARTPAPHHAGVRYAGGSGHCASRRAFHH